MKGTAKFALVMLAVFLCLVGFNSKGYSLEIGARAYYWFPDLTANIRMDEGSIGMNINVKDDLGIENKSFPTVEAFVGWGKNHISLMYMQVDYSGRRTINKPLTFIGKTFALNALVESDLKTRVLDLEYQYDFLNMENILAGFSVGAIGKIKYWEGEARMKSSTAGSAFDENETFFELWPMFGLGAHLGLLRNILEARAKVAGMSYSGRMAYDGMAEVSLTPFPFLDIHGGYRIMKLKIDNEGNFWGHHKVFVDMEFSGPYVGLTISF